MDADPGRRVGRRRRQSSNEAPVWFGLPFAGAGILVLILGLTNGLSGSGGLIAAAVGTLFFVVGVLLVWSSLRAARTFDHPAPRVNVGALDVERFTRSPMRVFVDLVAAPLGGVGFLGMAVFVLFSPMFFLAILPAFFGVLILKGAAITIRRGVGLTVATVGPGGIWTPELGQLAWSDIAELRVEDATGVAGGETATTATYRRIGIVPRSQELIENAPGRDAVGMVKAFSGFVNTIRPGTDLSDPSKMAPYGIQAYEIEQPFADLVRSVQRFAPIVGAEVALGDGTREVATSAGAEPVATAPIAVPAAPNLFETIGVPAPAFGALGEAVLPSFVPVASTPVAVAEARTFLRAGGPTGTLRRLSDLGMALPWVAFPAIFLVVVPATMLLNPDARAAPGVFFALAFLLMPLGFAAYGVLQVLALPGRWRMRSGDPQLLTVDAEGIDLRGMGRLRWSEIEDVRAVASNRPTGEDSPSIARLEIVPRDRSRLANRPAWDQRYDAWRSFLRRLKPFGDRSPVQPVFGIDLDLIDADPNDVIDLIARYRVVEDDT